MKKEVLMKLILILSMIGVLALTAVQVFAADADDPFGSVENNDSEDFTNQLSTEKENTNTDSNGILSEILGSSNNNTTTNNNNVDNDIQISVNTNNTNASSNELAHTGTNENIIVALIFVFGAVAIFAYIKLRSYKNL